MASAPTSISSHALAWADRGRFVLAAAVIWAGLHFLAGRYLPGGVDRPLVLATSPVAGMLVVVILALGGALARLLGAAPNPRRLFMILGTALLLWAAEGGRAGGTIDNWLVLRHPTPGPPTGGPYWLLLIDYAYLALGIGGACALTCQRRQSPIPQAVATASPVVQRTGALAFLVTLIVAGLAILILAGRTLGTTLRGQVYFAVGVGLLFGVWAAVHLTQVRSPLWYVPAPFVLGVVGLVVAGINPALLLPPEYRGLDILPAWGLCRALPVEMIGAGLVGALWLLHPDPAVAADDA